MTERELDLYASWESERCRLERLSEQWELKGNTTLARRFMERAKERYKCMRDLSREH